MSDEELIAERERLLKALKEASPLFPPKGKAFASLPLPVPEDNLQCLSPLCMWK